MEKLWAGRTAGQLSAVADDFNSSIHFDAKMYRQDIRGSEAHAEMLAEQGILTRQEADAIIRGLESIVDDMNSGRLLPDPGAEDIHMFVEAELTKRIGETGKRLHTARSRNDQVALDLRMYLREETETVLSLLRELIGAIREQAEAHQRDIMPGYTHLQRGQPIVFAQHILAYAMMLMRDTGRLKDALSRMDESPLGCCAMAGTTYPTNRQRTAELLGFSNVTANSIDGVSDRDFCVELLSAYSLIMTHLSRFSEEIILWSSWEFGFIELDDAFTTGSSIMPQKKNSDMAELVRGKTGRVYGDLIAVLTMLKGLPLAYDKDMQEDKEAVFDGVETVQKCLRVFAPMVRTMRVRTDRMLAAAQEGFLNATDLADYLVRKGMPFRTAYKITGEFVRRCIAQGCTLETLPLAEYKKASELFEDDLYHDIALETCVSKRISEGGTGPESVSAQLAHVAAFLADSASAENT